MTQLGPPEMSPNLTASLATLVANPRGASLRPDGCKRQASQEEQDGSEARDKCRSGETTVVDLGPEIEGMAGRQLRMRVLTIEPGGYIGLHSHEDRPAVVYFMQGTDEVGRRWQQKNHACRRHINGHQGYDALPPQYRK